MSTSRTDTLYRRRPTLVPVAEPHDEPPDTFESEPDETVEETASWRPRGLLEWFAVAQTALPALLYLPGNQQSRLVIRAAAFLISVAAFVFWYMDRSETNPIRHPAKRWLGLVLATLVLMMVHP